MTRGAVMERRAGLGAATTACGRVDEHSIGRVSSSCSLGGGTGWELCFSAPGFWRTFLLQPGGRAGCWLGKGSSAGPKRLLSGPAFRTTSIRGHVASEQEPVSDLLFSVSAVFIMAAGLLVYPFGLNSSLVRSVCGESDIYYAGECQIGWGYMLAIVGVMLTVFLPFFAKYAPKEQLSPTPLPTLL